MYQGASYIFAIQTKDYKFWKVVNGHVTVNAQPYFLNYAPAGRENIAVQNIRNRRYWAIDRSVVDTASYVNDGAQILKYILLNKGIEESVFVSILEQQLYYEPFPNAVLAFTSGQSPFTRNTTTTGTITGNPGDIVKVQVNLDFTGLCFDEINGNFDGFNFSMVGDLFPPVHSQVYDITIPSGGVINFSIDYIHGTGPGSVASMQLLNANGSSEFGYGYWYKQRSRPEFDLTTYSHEGASVKISTLEESLAKFLKANESTTIELPLDVSEAINVKMDGIRLHEKANYADVDGFDFSPVNLGGGATEGLTATIFLNNEGDHVGVSLESQSMSAYANFAAIVAADNCLFHNVYSVPLLVTISGKSEFVCTNQSGNWFLRRRFLLTSSTIPTQNDYLYHSSPILVPGTTYTQDFSVVLTVPPGERIHADAFFGGGISGNPAVQFTVNSRFSITFISRYEATYIKAFRAQYLFSKYIYFVGEGNYTAKQAQFFATHSDKVFTCGNAIRGFSDAVLKWNFSDFFQFWDCFSSVGLCEENGIIDFDEKQNLTDSSVVITLPTPSDIKVSIDRDLLYNVLKIGYPPIKNDVGVLNGNEEFNTGYEFSMGLMKKPAEIDKVSKINASCYAIEKIRVTTINKDTTDYKADNDVFPLVINNTLVSGSGDIPDHYVLDRSLNASCTGLIEPDSVFNMALSPHLNFKRNGPWLRSLLWLCDSKTLKYQSADKNNKLEFDDPLFGHIIEKADENIGGLGTRFITPVMFTITVPAPDDQAEADPRAVYEFPFLGTTWKCISSKDSTGLASRKPQTWELWALPDNDFSKLENYYG